LKAWSVWLDEFAAARSSQRYIFYSLFGYLSEEGFCCVISSLFPEYLAGRFDDVPFVKLYIASYGEHASQTIKCLLNFGALTEYLPLGYLRVEAISSNVLRGYRVLN
jgi:hypothetical protein